MEIVFVTNDFKKCTAFKAEKGLKEPEWNSFVKSTKDKLDGELGVIFWENHKMFPLKELDYQKVKKEL